MPVVTGASRFAPSPSGLLHRGHAFSALIADATARAFDERFLVRLEDIDAERCRPEFADAVVEDLHWLGLTFPPPERQSDHLADYASALARLQADGLVYRCFKTRAEVLGEISRAPHTAAAAFAPGPADPQTEARLLESGRPYAWRLSLPAARTRLGEPFDALTFDEIGAGPAGETGRQHARPERHGDFIVARKDLGVAYHLAVVVDDARQGVTHVVRGEDLFEATSAQRLLQALLGLPTPAYRHHRLILRPDGRRFAKRDQGETLRALRAAGVTPADLRRSLGLAGA